MKEGESTRVWRGKGRVVARVYRGIGRVGRSVDLVAT